MKEIKVSVIIPVYNTRQYLQECMDSILKQSLDSIEIIIVDDGSTDGSLELVKEYEKTHSNICVIYQKNKKQGAARNAGLKIARGEFVYFIDSDDILENHALEYCYNLASNKNLDMVVFEASIFGDVKGRNENEYLFHKRIKEIPFQINGIDYVEKYYNKLSLLNIPFTLYSRNFLKENNIFFLENTFYEDVAFYYKVMQYNPQIMIVDKVFYHRRYRSNSVMTTESNEISILNKINVYYKILDDSTDRMKNLYCTIAARGIRKALQEIVKYDISIGESSKNSIIRVVENFNGQINSISSFLDIQYCYFVLADLFNVEMCNNEVYDVVYDYLKNIKKQLNVYNNIKLGIYGRGDDCNLVFDLIRRVFGDFKCSFFYIQTEPVSGKNDDNMYCIDNIDDLQLDIIFIGSYYYEDDIMENIYKNCKQKYKVYSIKRDFHYFDLGYYK